MIIIRFEPSVQSVNDLVGDLAHESLFKPILVPNCCTTRDSRVREVRRKRIRIEPPQFIEERFSVKGSNSKWNNELIFGLGKK